MISVDAIIVGQGLAGTILAESLMQQNKTVCIIDNNKNVCSKVAAGLWNPIVFKRITKGWKVDELLPSMFNFYGYIEKKYTISLLQHIDIVKLFSSFEEQNDWHAKSNDDRYKAYLSCEKKAHYHSEHYQKHVGYGVVKHSGRLDINELLHATKNALLNQQHYLEETFDFSQLTLLENSVTYKHVSANSIVFCEGVNSQQNPYFSYVPIDSTKGEILHAEVDSIETDFILNKGFFMYPLAKGKYILGATYHWKTTDLSPTKEGEQELLEKYNAAVNQPLKAYNITVGLRPTTADRRPALGAHPEFKNMFIFNGLGTKGVMIAPYFAKHFVEHLYNNAPLDNEVSIERFKHLYHDKKN
jgi:glycine oxidase